MEASKRHAIEKVAQDNGGSVTDQAGMIIVSGPLGAQAAVARAMKTIDPDLTAMRHHEATKFVDPADSNE